ncbi:TonB-dependent receptor [Anaerorudis cellulosivorans]|uniref:TonB-dependent receptor n=1 Tax=Anaerorudis cellulosivorans TaxID=3397862 RepID=UPI00221F7A46|nr:TonB-dependent receptor [Seramator thermalis]MCW1735053.1 TonB-dependent receptor [Seramator thermalis]
MNKLLIVKKIPIAMRITCLLLCLIVFQLQAEDVYSQKTKISLDMKNTTIEKVLQTIEEKSDYHFLYNNKLVNVDRKVSVRVKDAAIADVLDKLFASEDVEYQVEGNQIILSPKEKVAELVSGVESAQQQQKTITGKVTDTNGEPIIGATILVKGTTIGTVTDTDGNFSLRIPVNAQTLQVSFVGMKTQEIPIANRTTFNVALEEEAIGLEEVVAVGYGIQRKVTATSAVTKIEGERIEKMTMVNTIKALQGLSPGITIVDRGGAPGSDNPEIYIRGVGTTGNATPVVIIDGIEMSLASLSQLPASEIENISVLKDAASTSIYGSRGAHGVILVTTKRGKEGDVQLSYNGSIGLQDRAIKAKQVTAREYMTMVNEALVNAGMQSKYSEEDIQITETGTDPYHYSFTNWPNEVYRSNYITQHALNLAGGGNKGRYRLSFDYLDQPGLTDNTKYQRYNYRANTDLNVGKMLKINSDITYRHVDRLWPEGLGDALAGAWSMSPTAPLRYKNGDYALDDQLNNVISYLDLNVVGENRYNLDVIFGQIKGDFEPIKDLVFTGIVALNGSWDRNKIHYKNHKYYNELGELISQRNPTNSVVDRRNNNYQMTLRFLANYKKNFYKKHNLAILYGMEQISYRNYYSMAQRKNLISDALPDVSLGSAGSQFAEGYPSKWGINSFFGRVNYGFEDKYLFEANFRSDGSSRFSKENRWGTFPSFSAAWRVSEESFMKNLSFINNLKLRISWGQNGNERIGEFRYLPQYNTSNVVMNGELVTAVYQQRMANPEITWEKVEQTDIGLDFNILNNSIYSEIDLYRKDTKDILLTLSIPKFIGLDPPEQNVGIVRNSGVEAMIGFRQKIKSLSFNTSVNLTYNKNKWVDRAGDDNHISGWTIERVGSPLNSFYIYQADGLIANEKELQEYKTKYESDPRGMSVLHAGDVKLVDVNGDGAINPGDRQVFTSNIPKFTYGWNINVGYKNFDLSLLLQGSSGANRMIYGEWIEGPSYEQFTGLHFRDRWTEKNQNRNAKMPRMEAANNRNASTYNSFFLKKVNYLRLKNAQLGYTFSDNVASKMKISKLRFYLTGSNLFTLSSMDQGLDPEARSGRISDFPTLKIINFGMNITF